MRYGQGEVTAETCIGKIFIMLEGSALCVRLIGLEN